MPTIILERSLGHATLRLVQGDLTLAETDAIVNAANTHLAHGGGVAGAIVRRGGHSIQDESDAIGHCAEGDAVVTGAGRLAARYVIHAVGPQGHDPQADTKLASAIRRSLERADELGLASISIPAVSSGIFGFPKDRCAQILYQVAEEYLTTHPASGLRQVDFCNWDDETVGVFEREWRARWPS